jgi:hypothetical protein
MYKLLIILISFILALDSNAEEVKQDDFFPIYNAMKRSPDEGCTLNGQIYAVGYVMAMNKDRLLKFKQMTGYNASDGLAVLMQCLYLVNPKSNDHPTIQKRKYVWVAG